MTRIGVTASRQLLPKVGPDSTSYNASRNENVTHCNFACNLCRCNIASVTRHNLHSVTAP